MLGTASTARARHRRYPMQHQFTRFPSPAYNQSVVDRFWSYVAIADTDDCWLWQASGKGKGYGQIGGYSGGKQWMMQAHRLAWEISSGPIPDGLFVCHTCDNRTCVRNDDEGWYEVNGILHPRRGHLWLGTAKDNADDMMAKQRNMQITRPETIARGERSGKRTHPETIARGEEHGRAKLSDADVRGIRHRKANGAILRELAAEFGVSMSAISRIARSDTWPHVK